MNSGNRTPVRFNRFWLLLLILPVGIAGLLLAQQTPEFCGQNPTICVRIAYYRYVDPWLSTPQPINAATTISKTNDELPFYGMQYVPDSDMELVADLGINTILQDFSRDGTPQEWLAMLDAAEERNLKVVAWQWPPGWEREESGEWTIHPQARLFVETVVDHPALFAIYGTHEAYWNGCFGCQHTTVQLQDLYSQIKNIADVPIYSAFENYTFWRQYSDETTFADGICDYCDTWYYPVLDSGYDRDEYVRRLAEEIETFRELAPNSKFVWVLQSFGSTEHDRVMPSAEQMSEMASIALASDVDGVWWYVWTFSDVYEDYLINYPELHPVVRNIYDDFYSDSVDETEQEFTNQWYLPIVGNSMQFLE